MSNNKKTFKTGDKVTSTLKSLKGKTLIVQAVESNHQFIGRDRWGYKKYSYASGVKINGVWYRATTFSLASSSSASLYVVMNKGADVSRSTAAYDEAAFIYDHEPTSEEITKILNYEGWDEAELRIYKVGAVGTLEKTVKLKWD